MTHAIATPMPTNIRNVQAAERARSSVVPRWRAPSANDDSSANRTINWKWVSFMWARVFGGR